MISNNRRIARNTLMLYFRMMLIMAVTLYTSRVVLEVLGVEDFGIYNVVGGVVAMLGFLNSSMSITTQRFMNFEMGRKNYIKLNQVFSLSVSIHIVIAIILFILAETIGLWFLNNKLTLPPERMIAANWIYHFSVLSAVVTVIQVPYNAAIIAYERMIVYAYVSIVEVILKLAIVFALQWAAFDKLKFYAVLVFSVSLIIQVIYQIYCRRNFAACKFHIFWDKTMFNDIFNMSSWGLIGTGSNMVMHQGVKIVLNQFFGVALNAAAGVAGQLNDALSLFSNNFMTAMRPQIVKLYAAGKLEETYQLVFRGALFTFFLIFLIKLPFFLLTEIILSLWLKDVPAHTVLFTQLIMIVGLIESLTLTLRSVNQASGDVKRYVLSLAPILLLTIPASYFFYYLGFPPQAIYFTMMGATILTLFTRVFVLQKTIHLPVGRFIQEVLLRAIKVALPSLAFGLLLKQMPFPSAIIELLVVVPASLIMTAVMICTLGLDQTTRKMLLKYISEFINKIKSKA